MTQFMLDTNTISDLLKGQSNVARRVSAAGPKRLCLSVVTEGELHYGLAKRPDAKKLQTAVRELLLAIEILPWTSDVARRYGAMRADLERRGRPLGSLDLMIAAHALERDAILASRDKGFRAIPGLKVEDWTLA